MHNPVSLFFNPYTVRPDFPLSIAGAVADTIASAADPIQHSELVLLGRGLTAAKAREAAAFRRAADVYLNQTGSYETRCMPASCTTEENIVAWRQAEMAGILRGLSPAMEEAVVQNISPPLERVGRLLHSAQFVYLLGSRHNDESITWNGEKRFLGVGPKTLKGPKDFFEPIRRAPFLGFDFLALAGLYFATLPGLGRTMMFLTADYLLSLLLGYPETHLAQNMLAHEAAIMPQPAWHRIYGRLENPWLLHGGIWMTPPPDHFEPPPHLTLIPVRNRPRVRNEQQLEELIRRRLAEDFPPHQLLAVECEMIWPPKPIFLPPEECKEAGHKLAPNPLTLLIMPDGQTMFVYIVHDRLDRWKLHFSPIRSTPIRNAALDQSLTNFDSHEIGYQRFYSPDQSGRLDRVLQLGRIVEIPTVENPTPRQKRDLGILAAGRSFSAADHFRRRLWDDPALLEWLNLPDNYGSITVSVESLRDNLFKGLRETQRCLARAWIRHASKFGEEEREKLFAVLFPFGLRTICKGKLPAAPRRRPISEKEMSDLIAVLENFSDATQEQREILQVFLDESLRVRHILDRLPELPAEGEIFCHIQLETRTSEAIDLLRAPFSFFSDPSQMLLSARWPNGFAAGGLLLQLFFDGDGNRWILYQKVDTSGTDKDWKTPKIDLALEFAAVEIAYRMNVPVERLHEVTSLDRRQWGNGLVAAGHDPALDAYLRRMTAQFPHPHARLVKPGDGNYEALKPLPNGRIAILNPWTGSPIPGGESPESFLVRDTEPQPDPKKFDQYRFGFTTTGRSVNFPIRFTDENGTHWNYLDGIGVPTLQTRDGRESRDGRSAYSNAIRRFYYAKMMHHIGGPLGFRTSRPYALVEIDPEKKGAALKDLSAIVWELRREQLRLWDLSLLPQPEKALEMFREELAQEGIILRNNSEYVAWFAKTLGEQMAIMHFLELDHGTFDVGTGVAPQLHSGNISPLGEVFDLEVARISREAWRRYVAADKHRVAQRDVFVDLDRIRREQARIRRKGIPKKPTNWMEWMLQRHPDLDFYEILLEAKRAKLNELKKLGIDPRAEIIRFNKERWIPGIRSQKFHGRV